MKKTITLLTILYAATMFSQNFTAATDTPFIGTTDGSAHLVDVDGDGDLDFFNTGDQGGSGFQGIAQLFTNDGSGTFTLVTGTPFPGTESASAAFADFDADGDVDLILTGKINDDDEIANMYTNDGSGSFTLVVGTPFLGVSLGDVVVADLDGDTDLDVIISGYNSEAVSRISVVYKNDGTGAFDVFTPSPAFEVANEGDVDMADVDGDGDEDLLVTGFVGPGEMTKFYTNDGTGVFTEDATASALFTDMRDSDADFADVDGDGDQDLLINGRFGSSDRVAELYLNDGTGTFALAAGTPFIGGNAGTVDFFDADNDGDMDVLLSGYENSTPHRNTRLYSNDGDGNFTEETSETITGINNADIAIGDIDGNLTKDIVIVGYSNTRLAELYTNNGTPLNIDNAEVWNGISVYPIPSKGELYVRPEQNNIRNIQLFDITGSLVKNIILNNSRMDISSLPKGLYVLKINFETTSPTIKKIIKN